MPTERHNKICDITNTDDKRCTPLDQDNIYRRRMSVDVGILVAQGREMDTERPQRLPGHNDRTTWNCSLPQKGLSPWETVIGKNDPEAVMDSDTTSAPLTQHSTSSSACARWAFKRRAWSLINRKATDQKRRALHRSETYHHH